MTATETPRSSLAAVFRLRRLLPLVTALYVALVPSLSRGDEPPPYPRQELIYGRKYGLALTLNVFRPSENPNGLGIVFVISGGWFSTHEAAGALPRFNYLLDRGYTVFAVTHGRTVWE